MGDLLFYLVLAVIDAACLYVAAYVVSLPTDYSDICRDRHRLQTQVFDLLLKLRESKVEIEFLRKANDSLRRRLDVQKLTTGIDTTNAQE